MNKFIEGKIVSLEVKGQLKDETGYNNFKVKFEGDNAVHEVTLGPYNAGGQYPQLVKPDQVVVGAYIKAYVSAKGNYIKALNAQGGVPASSPSSSNGSSAPAASGGVNTSASYWADKGNYEKSIRDPKIAIQSYFSSLCSAYQWQEGMDMKLFFEQMEQLRLKAVSFVEKDMQTVVNLAKVEA